MNEENLKNSDIIPPETSRKGFAQPIETKNLRFLTDLLSALNMTTWDYGRLESNQISASTALRRQLLDDDMKISKAKEIVSRLGYELEFKLTDKNHTQQTASIPGVNIILPENLQHPLEFKNKNIGFLLEYMKRQRITKTDLAEKLGITRGAILAWIRKDDMLVSYIYKIRETYNAELDISFKNK